MYLEECEGGIPLFAAAAAAVVVVKDDDEQQQVEEGVVLHGVNVAIGVVVDLNDRKEVAKMMKLDVDKEVEEM